MVIYTKEIYTLKNKSKEGFQHFGFIISVDGSPMVRQWHKPKVAGHVFMTEIEANECANEMINEFNDQKNLPFEK